MPAELQRQGFIRKLSARRDGESDDIRRHVDGKDPIGQGLVIEIVVVERPDRGRVGRVGRVVAVPHLSVTRRHGRGPDRVGHRLGCGGERERGGEREQRRREQPRARGAVMAVGAPHSALATASRRTPHPAIPLRPFICLFPRRNAAARRRLRSPPTSRSPPSRPARSRWSPTRCPKPSR